jgi:two-component system chemotaxis sensor kinase CheA
MDWGDNSELQDIFRAEVAEMAGRLLEGARAIVDDSYSSSPSHELTRAAHTIKGSGRVMGFDYAADAAVVLEEIWKAIESGMRTPTRSVGERLVAVAAAMPVAVNSGSETDIAALRAAVTELGRHVGNANPVPPPGGDSPKSVEAPAPAPSLPPVAHGTDEVDGQVDLGGLLSSLHDRMAGGTTRVEVQRLYQLINRAVEARLDANVLESSLNSLPESASLDPNILEMVGRWRQAARSLELALSDVERQALDLSSGRLRELTTTFPQLLRFVSRRTGKEVRFELVGDDIDLDRQILERLHEPLRHILVNAVDHGIEPAEERLAAGKQPTGSIALRASVVAHRLRITVEDDGRGIDWTAVAKEGLKRNLLERDVPHADAELAGLLYQSGFSTHETSNDVSGDGLGLWTAAQAAEQLNGSLSVDSKPGMGTTVTLVLPASLALQDLLLVESEGQQWGIPVTAVEATMRMDCENPEYDGTQRVAVYRGERIPVAAFSSAVGLGDSDCSEHLVVLSTRTGSVGLTVPRLIGRRQVAVKGIGPMLGGVPHLTGAAMLGGGQVVVIVEPNRLGDMVRATPTAASTRPRVLVVDDSAGVRQLVAAALSSSGFDVVLAGDADQALGHLERESFDALVVDYLMPGSDGVELVRDVRATQRSLRIVMVSGVATDEDKDRAWSAGVNAYLDKFDLRQGVLVQTLRSLLGLAAEPRLTLKEV